MASSELPSDVVRAAVHHMNADHAADALAIVRALGGLEQAESVETVDVDVEAVHFVASGAGGSRRLRVPFDAPVTDRPSLRAAMVLLARRAREQLR